MYVYIYPGVYMYMNVLSACFVCVFEAPFALKTKICRWRVGYRWYHTPHRNADSSNRVSTALSHTHTHTHEPPPTPPVETVNAMLPRLMGTGRAGGHREKRLASPDDHRYDIIIIWCLWPCDIKNLPWFMIGRSPCVQGAGCREQGLWVYLSHA